MSLYDRVLSEARESGYFTFTIDANAVRGAEKEDYTLKDFEGDLKDGLRKGGFSPTKVTAGRERSGSHEVRVYFKGVRDVDKAHDKLAAALEKATDNRELFHMFGGGTPDDMDSVLD